MRARIRRKKGRSHRNADVDNHAPPKTASPAAHCSPVHVAGNPLPGAVATFDYMFFFRIAPMARKCRFVPCRTGIEASDFGVLLTNALVRKRTIRPQLNRIFCKLILRTGVTLGDMRLARRILDRARRNLNLGLRRLMRQTFRTVSQVLDGPRNARTYSRQRKLASFCAT